MTDVSPMVERVAQALYEVIRQRTIGTTRKSAALMRYWNEIGPAQQDFHRAQARAAIKAMREPTPMMLNAGVHTTGIFDPDPASLDCLADYLRFPAEIADGPDDTHDASAKVIATVHAAMISAALGEDA